MPPLKLKDVLAMAPPAEVQDAEELGSALDPKTPGKSLREIMQNPPGEKRDAAVRQVKGFRTEAGAIRKELKSPSYKDFQGVLAEAQKNAPKEEPGFVRKVATLVDTPARKLVREPIASVAGLPEGAAKESGTFHEALRKKYGEDTFHIPGNPLPKGMGRDFVDDTAMDLVTDPLSYIGVGEAGKAMSGVEKLLGAGHEAIPAIREAMSTLGGMQKFNKVRDILRENGVADSAIRKTFGEAGEFFGNKGLSIKNNTLGSLLREGGAEKLGKKLQEGIGLLPGYVESKVIQTAAKPVTNILETAKTAEGRKSLGTVGGILDAATTPGQRGLFDITQRANERQALARMARATEEMTKQDILTKAVPIKQFADKNPKRAEELLRFHVDPASKEQFAATSASMTPAEKQWVSDIQALFQEHTPFIQQLGLKLEKNAISGHYYPRVYDKGGQGGLDILQALFAPNPNRVSGLPTAGKIFKPRTANVPLGSPAAPPATIDPGKVIAGYGRQISAAKGYKQLEGDLAKSFGKDPEAERFLASQYDQHHRQLEQALKRLKGEESLPEAIGNKALGAYDSASRWWKKWTTQHFPGYHIANEVGDVGMMYQAGMNNPAKWLGRSRELIAKAQAGDEAALRTLQEAQSFGIGHGALDRSGGLPGFADDLAELEKMAGSHHGASGGVSGLLDKLPAWMHINSKTGHAWDLQSRLAAYLHGVEGMGMSPRDAADASYRALLDYGRRGIGDNILKRVFPFTEWQRQAPLAAVRSIAENPGRFDAVTHALSNAGSGEKRHGSLPTWAEDKSLYLRVPDAGRAVFDKAAKAVGAEPVLGDLQIPARYGPQEAISPLSGPGASGEAGSIVRGLLGAANPFLKFPLQEALSQMQGKPDLLTGRESKRAFEGKGWLGTLGRLGLEVLTPRVAVPLVNAVSREAGGPANLAGRYQERAPDKRGRTLKDLLGVAGFKPIETNASTALSSIRDSEAFQDLKRRTEESKKAAKERKKKGKK